MILRRDDTARGEAIDQRPVRGLVGEADGVGVDVGEFFLEKNADLFAVGPIDFAGHDLSSGVVS